MSQEGLGEAIRKRMPGFSSTSVSRWERGAQCPDAYYVARVREVLEVDAGKLLGSAKE
jgi:hypothetical protein